jgi:hypothetical protein
MHENYEDIRGKISELPQWFDEHAVPRYCAFEPGRSADIYADEVVLAAITCQDCGHPFRVAFSQNSFDTYRRNGRRLADDIREQTLHYGDPPNIGCCPAGPTMNSEPRRVLEYWHRPNFDWQRDPALELKIEPDWVNIQQSIFGNPDPQQPVPRVVEAQQGGANAADDQREPEQ